MKKIKTIPPVFLVFLPVAVWCFIFATLGTGSAAIQDDIVVYLPAVMRDFNSGPGTVAGRVIDASNLNPISGARVCFADSLCSNADSNGDYSISGIPAGFWAGTASASGFISVTHNTKVIAEETATQHFMLSPILSANIAYRIVLTWDPTPVWPPNNWDNDLDAYLWLDALLPRRIYSGDPGDCTNYPNACLEVDIQQGSGPETVAIRYVENAVYHFGILNVNQIFDPNVPPITQTSAKVQIYGREGFYEAYDVPTSGQGDFWYVFSMNDLGEITSVNCITTEPADLADLLAKCP